MGRKLISSVEEFNNILIEENRFLLIKHSLTCPISQSAFEEFENYSDDHELPCYYLYVQEARPLSNYIAETYDVKHESPQALLFEDQKVVWNDSHWNITYDKLQKQLN